MRGTAKINAANCGFRRSCTSLLDQNDDAPRDLPSLHSLRPSSSSSSSAGPGSLVDGLDYELGKDLGLARGKEVPTPVVQSVIQAADQGNRGVTAEPTTTEPNEAMHPSVCLTISSSLGEQVSKPLLLPETWRPSYDTVRTNVHLLCILRQFLGQLSCESQLQHSSLYSDVYSHHGVHITALRLHRP